MKFTEHRNYSTTWFHCSLNQKRVYIKYKCYISTARSICFSSTENQTFKDNVNTIRWDHHWTCHLPDWNLIGLICNYWEDDRSHISRIDCVATGEITSCYVLNDIKKMESMGLEEKEEGGYCSEGQEHNQRLPDPIWTHGSFSSANFSPRLSKKKKKLALHVTLDQSPEIYPFSSANETSSRLHPSPHPTLSDWVEQACGLLCSLLEHRSRHKDRHA